MLAHETGTNRGSVVFTHKCTPGEFPLSFQVIVTGEYHCNHHYRVDRNRFDSFLLIYVISGSGYICLGNQKYDLIGGSIVLLDCYEPHRYGTLEEMHIQWLHFDGPMARNYYQRAIQHGPVLQTLHHYPATHNLRKILRTFQSGQGVSDLLLSKWINDLMTDIIQDSEETYGTAKQSAVIDESVRYISEHLNKNISIQDLASLANLSLYYFSRLFKQETGMSPHRYIIMVRLEYSCFLLRSSNLTIKEIAYQCGFNSESNFCTRFRSVYRCTPQQFRLYN